MLGVDAHHSAGAAVRQASEVQAGGVHPSRSARYSASAANAASSSGDAVGSRAGAKT
jgi:hypothetical protein